MKKTWVLLFFLIGFFLVWRFFHLEADFPLEIPKL